jgi:hypothetical protein
VAVVDLTRMALTIQNPRALAPRDFNRARRPFWLELATAFNLL